MSNIQDYPFKNEEIKSKPNIKKILESTFFLLIPIPFTYFFTAYSLSPFYGHILFYVVISVTVIPTMIYYWWVTRQNPGYSMPYRHYLYQLEQNFDEKDPEVAGAELYKLLKIYPSQNAQLMFGQHGREEIFKYCENCQTFKPLRCSHSKAAFNRCVMHFDHYCPWIGNPVGFANQSIFINSIYLKISYIVLMLVFCCATIIINIAQLITCGIDDIQMHSPKHMQYLCVNRLYNLSGTQIIQQKFIIVSIVVQIAVLILATLFASLINHQIKIQNIFMITDVKKREAMDRNMNYKDYVKFSLFDKKKHWKRMQENRKLCNRFQKENYGQFKLKMRELGLKVKEIGAKKAFQQGLDKMVKELDDLEYTEFEFFRLHEQLKEQFYANYQQVLQYQKNNIDESQWKMPTLLGILKDFKTLKKLILDAAPGAYDIHLEDMNGFIYFYVAIVIYENYDYFINKPRYVYNVLYDNMMNVVISLKQIQNDDKKCQLFRYLYGESFILESANISLSCSQQRRLNKRLTRFEMVLNPEKDEKYIKYLAKKKRSKEPIYKPNQEQIIKEMENVEGNMCDVNSRTAYMENQSKGDKNVKQQQQNATDKENHASQSPQTADTAIASPYPQSAVLQENQSECLQQQIKIATADGQTGSLCPKQCQDNNDVVLDQKDEAASPIE